jgi:drug/metabolite transporter (DMT)-like permease
MSTSDPDHDPQRDPPSGKHQNGSDLPRWLFPLEIGYVIALVAVLLLYHHNDAAHRLVPDPAGPIPLGVVWWGALGGVTISLTGIFRHPRSWDDAYNRWHIARPVLGAVMGTVGYLIFVVVIQAAGPSEVEAGNGSPIFYLVAFLLGYREQVFRDVLRKAVDTLIAPGRDTT